ncbi:MAG: hypothetical protein ACTSPJ_03345 [Candidatus Heimdallarchaeaceae archaeon]
MVKTIMIRMNQKKLSNSALERIYDALEGEKVVIRRIFDRRFSASCDDLIIEGELDNFLKKIVTDDIDFVSVKFQVELGDLHSKLDDFCALSINQNNQYFYFGTTLINYEFVSTRLRIPSKEQILSLLFRSLLGSKFISLMPVKIKGLVSYSKSDNSLSFIYPSQRVETLKQWIYVFSSSEKVDFDTLVDIFKKTDPEMRKNLEDTLNWITGQLPEIVAKSTTIETIDILRSYQKSFKFVI